MTERIRAVLFDLGDTLWHFPEMPPGEAIAVESGKRIDAQLARWGLTPSGGVRHPGPGRGAQLAAAVMEADKEATRLAEFSHGRSPDFGALVQERARAHGIELTAAQSSELWDVLHVGGRFLRRRVFPDSIPMLEELRRRGYRVGSVTNRSLGGLRFREELRLVAMDSLFECMIVSCDEGWLKPHRALFERAVAALEVTYEETVMVGDDLRADVMGAKSLGMTAVWKRPPARVQEPHPLPDGTKAHPDFVIDHPAELLDLPIFKSR